MKYHDRKTLPGPRLNPPQKLADEFSKKIGERVRFARFPLNNLGSGIIFGWKFPFQMHDISLNFEQQNRRPSPKPFAGEGVSGMGFEINPQLTIRILKALFGKSTAGMGFEVFFEIFSLFGAAKG